MPRHKVACRFCGKPSSAGRCRHCALQFGLRNYSIENAKAQKITIITQPKDGGQRGSWWLGTSPKDFTAYASVMVVNADWVKPKTHNWMTEY